MTLLDRFVSGREQLLNRILGGASSDTLNSLKTGPIQVETGTALAAELKNTVNQFKDVAMDASGSLVDYQQLAQHSSYQTYRDLVVQLQDFELKSLRTNQERLSFWINIYNSLVVDAVIQFGVNHSVVDSRLGILSFFQKAAYLINGQRFSLLDIEHGVLRGNRGFPYFPGLHFSSRDPRRAAVITPVDPRIHFTLNCASKSCPPIGVYSPENIEEQLNMATSNFIFQDLELDSERKQILLSRIFRWYQVDFGGHPGIIAFLLKHSQNPKTASFLEEHRKELQLLYHPYDWGLNQFSRN
jgi:hypothetical protein